ncbi:hypothetical protein G6F46_010629 [Rhizopus delemar]|uniref:Uncharacterized protein n=3 Tax=Rhizopus TaxID=4842 RepID=I1C0Y6_RHIO9|nr:hypothetical protein RO3G_06821 [Rhizopus delemar RA 99-880]KAG1449965.1 hypothetical protein G6F55_009917 [Rhizopus delemar]KAG1542534.1 hypothetical protein G6F51_007211 [Rhizopus arrhizus]KAG1491098.1 hypothetical protein G6F54_010259 [Rhizopus delemar]KAG1504429.1 hypothetical protein G6F53_010399 [Rhizopus delemar]|eukprot:EIE82116.1 hypothetical protein RO3G_06821 [Rhizopus delemar RA 99-880]
MGFKKLFSSKEVRYDTKNEPTKSSRSLSLNKWSKKRPSSSIVSSLSSPINRPSLDLTMIPIIPSNTKSTNPFEQTKEKVELPATPSPSDKEEDDSLLQCNTKQVLDMKQRLENVNKKLNEALEKTDDFETEFKSRESSRKRMMSELNRVVSENELLKRELEGYLKTEDQIRGLLKGMDEDQIVEGVSYLRSLCDTLTAQKEQLDKKYSSAETNYQKALEAQREEMEKRREDEMNRLLQSHQSELERLTNKFQAEYKALEQAYDTARSQLSYEIHQTMTEKTEIENQLDALTQAHHQQSEVIKESKTRQASLERELGSAEGFNLQLQKEIRGLGETKEREMERLRDQVATVEIENKELREQLVGLEEFFAQKEIEFKKEGLKKESDLADKNADVERLEKENEKLKMTIQSLQQESTNTLKPGNGLMRTKSGLQDDLIKMHTKAQLGLIEYLEGEDDVIQAMSRFKRQLETEMQEPFDE